MERGSLLLHLALLYRFCGLISLHKADTCQAAPRLQTVVFKGQVVALSLHFIYENIEMHRNLKEFGVFNLYV